MQQSASQPKMEDQLNMLIQSVQGLNLRLEAAEQRAAAAEQRAAAAESARGRSPGPGTTRTTRTSGLGGTQSPGISDAFSSFASRYQPESFSG